MKKLEDLSREHPFKVPDGYFEKLPGVIQTRVAKPEPKAWFTPSFRLSMSVVAVVLVVALWITSHNTGNSIEEQLNEIQTQELMTYLDENELSVELLTEDVSLGEDDLIDLEEVIFSAMEPIDITIDELSVEQANF